MEFIPGKLRERIFLDMEEHAQELPMNLEMFE